MFDALLPVPCSCSFHNTGGGACQYLARKTEKPWVMLTYHPRPFFQSFLLLEISFTPGPEKGHNMTVGQRQRCAMPTATGTKTVLAHEFDHDLTMHRQSFPYQKSTNGLLPTLTREYLHFREMSSYQLCCTKWIVTNTRNAHKKRLGFIASSYH